jgi:hypothetical protein
MDYRCLCNNLSCIPLAISLRVVLLDCMIDLFSFLRSLHIVFQSGFTGLHSNQKCMRVPFSSHSDQYLLLVVFLMVAILTVVRWNLSVILICISFMAWDDEHFFHVFFFLTIWNSSFEKVLFISVAHFFIG